MAWSIVCLLVLPISELNAPTFGNCRLAVVQTNLADDIFCSEAGRAHSRKTIINLTTQAAAGGAEFILLPESVAPPPGVYDDEILKSALLGISKIFATSILVGSDSRLSENEWINGSFFFHKGTGPWGPYVKQKLVFGYEFCPPLLLAWVPEGLGHIRSAPWTEGFHLENPEIAIQPVICLEALTTSVNPRIPTLISVHGNSSYDRIGFISRLMLAKIVVLSWKSGLTILVSNNTGPSAIIVRGKITAFKDRGESGVLSGNL